jgi:tagatose 6-phosphate kinase
VLSDLGIRCEAVGLGSGTEAESLVDELVGAGVPAALVGTMPLRRTLVVQGDDGTTTSLWEPGHPLHDPDAAEDLLVAEVAQRLPRARVLTVSGSLPPGADPDLPVRLAALAARAGVPCVLDLDGEPQLRAAAARSAVLTPNVDELGRLTGHRPGSVRESAAAAERLVRGGVPMVLATLGAEGVVVVAPHGAAHARLPEPLPGNATGAGDAACAALARGLADAGRVAALDLRALVHDVVAVSGAAVLQPVAGAVDPVDVARLARLVHVEAL